MQQILRTSGSGHMTNEAHQMFLRLHSEGNLLKPEVPGHVIAALVLQAPPALSGQFVSWDEDKCKEFILPG
jgi:hypothetical protein